MTRKDNNNGVGRPSKYDPATMPDRAKKLCMLGFTNEQLALAFDVSVSSIDMWIRVYEEFSRAIKEGREVADHEVVKSLYQRAVGYSHPEDKILVVDKAVEVVPTTKHYPPDTTACIFWLKNRQRANWKDVWRIETTDGKQVDLADEIAKMDLSDMTDEELLILDRLRKRMTNETQPSDNRGMRRADGNEHPG